MKRYLAFDLGASNGRGILGTLDGHVLTLQEINRFENAAVKVGDYLYWDVLYLFNQIKTGIRTYALDHKQPLDGIGIDTWGVDYGFLDAHGELLSNPYNYRDGQTDGMMEAAFERISREDIFRHTGLAFMKFNTLYQLLALKLRNASGLKQAQSMLFMPDLLGWMLTGEKTVEYTVASTSQMLDVNTRTWSQEVLKALELPTQMLGEVRQPGRLLGHLRPEIQAETQLDAPVYTVAGHDTASAVVAVPATGHNHAYLSSGTWSLMGIETTTPIATPEMLEGNFTNEGGVFGTYRILKNIMGLWIVQEVRRAFKERGQTYSFAELADMAAASPSLVSFIDPDAEDFFAPGNMPEKVQAYCQRTGQAVPQTPGEINCCVLQSLAMRYRWCMERLEKLSGQPLDTLHIVGGGCQNALLNQMTANAIGRPVVCGPVEATAIGNLLMQAVGDGVLSGLEEAREVVRASFDLITYKPEDTELWNQAYERFLAVTE